MTPAHARGVLQAQWRLLGDLGGLAGPVAAGVLMTVYGARVAFLAYVPPLLVVALLLASVARETRASRAAYSGASSR